MQRGICSLWTGLVRRGSQTLAFMSIFWLCVLDATRQTESLARRSLMANSAGVYLRYWRLPRHPVSKLKTWRVKPIGVSGFLPHSSSLLAYFLHSYLINVRLTLPSPEKKALSSYILFAWRSDDAVKARQLPLAEDMKCHLHEVPLLHHAGPYD